MVNIKKSDVVRGNAVSQLMADDLERDGKAVEEFSVPVAEHHLLAVPERVVVFDAEMNAGIECSAGVVDRIATVGVEIEVERSAETVVGLVSGGIADRLAAFLPNWFSWQLLRTAGIVNRAALFWGYQFLAGQYLGETGCQYHRTAQTSNRIVRGQCLQRGRTLLRRSVLDDVIQHMRRHDAQHRVG